jgi:tRNA A37 threonylcarbamoyltransferase TsaD
MRKHKPYTTIAGNDHASVFLGSKIARNIFCKQHDAENHYDAVQLIIAGAVLSTTRLRRKPGILSATGDHVTVIASHRNFSADRTVIDSIALSGMIAVYRSYTCQFRMLMDK